MAITLTINTVDRTVYTRHANFSVSKQLSNESLDMTIVDPFNDTASAYRPAVGDVIRLLHNADLLFGGIIINVEDSRIVDNYGTSTKFTARDWMFLADQTFVPVRRFDGETVGSIFDLLITTYLADRGVTNITGGLGGPALPLLVVDDPMLPLRSLLDRITEQSGWPWRINGDLQAAIVEPGILPAPVTLNETNGHVLLKPGVRWNQQIARKANRLFMKTSPKNIIGNTDTPHHEDHVADGVKNYFPVNVLPGERTAFFDDEAGATAGTVTLSYVGGLPQNWTIPAGATFTIPGHTLIYETSGALTSDGDGVIVAMGINPGLESAIENRAQMVFDSAAFVALELNGVATPLDGSPWLWDPLESAFYTDDLSIPTAGVVVTYRTRVTFPVVLRSWAAAAQDTDGRFDRSQLVDGKEESEEYADLGTAKTHLDTLLGYRVSPGRRVRMSTRLPGWYPLLTATIDMPNRLLNGSFLVENVTIRAVDIDPTLTTNELLYELELIEGDRKGESWLDYFRGKNANGLIRWGATPVPEDPEFVMVAGMAIEVLYD